MDPERGPAAGGQEAEDELNVELDDEPDLAAPASDPGDDVLEITLDDLDADPLTDAPAEFPALTVEQSRAAIPSVVVPCLCSATTGHFEVRFEEGNPGEFWAAEAAITAPKAAGGKAAMSQVAGSFRMGEEYHCPHCGSQALSICDGCGVVLCLGALDKSGRCRCPSCHSTLTPGGPADAAPSSKAKKG